MLFAKFQDLFLKTLITIALTGSLIACTSHQLFNTGQAWQTNKCLSIANANDRALCENSKMSYEEYEKSRKNNSNLSPAKH
jgi:hypothetical protein